MLKGKGYELYDKLFKRLKDTPKAFYHDKFEVIDGCLYYKGKDEPLLKKRTGELRLIEVIEKIFGMNRLHDLGFESSKRKVTSRQAVILNKAEEELPSAYDVDKADKIELQEITENTAKSMEDLFEQFEGHEMLPM